LVEEFRSFSADVVPGLGRGDKPAPTGSLALGKKPPFETQTKQGCAEYALRYRGFRMDREAYNHFHNGIALTRRAEARRLHIHDTRSRHLVRHSLRHAVMARQILDGGWFYSVRRALMGWMEAARFAGMMAAKKEQMASAPAATVRANGSQEETP
jgi:hypothetical protein